MSAYHTQIESAQRTNTQYFTRETLAGQSTDNLLILLPDGYYIGKEAGSWVIYGADDHFTNPSYPGNLRECLIDFLVQYPFTGDEIEITRWAISDFC